MTPPAARRRSQFIDAVIDAYAAAHSTPPDADQLELQRITQAETGPAAGMQCRFSSTMSLSRIACRLNVACDMFVRI